MIKLEIKIFIRVSERILWPMEMRKCWENGVERVLTSPLFYRKLDIVKEKVLVQILGNDKRFLVYE